MSEFKSVFMERMGDVAFWRALMPGLSVGGNVYSWELLDISSDEMARQVEKAKVDGYFSFLNVFSEGQVSGVRDGISNLHLKGLFPVFMAVYDELWEFYWAMSEMGKSFLGEDYYCLPDFWAWFIPQSDDAKGWIPHRDKLYCTVDDEGMPLSMTLWVALTDAMGDNGCIYCLPASRDVNYPHNPNLVIEKYQDIRALPVPAGSVLGWNHSMFHWGGASSKFAKSPRISLGFEMQRAGIPVMREPLFDFSQPLNFEQRLGLIGKQILHYQHTYKVDDWHLEVAEKLCEEFPLFGDPFITL